MGLSSHAPLQVLPAAPSDAADFARIHRLAFASGPKFVNLFSNCTEEALDAHMIMRVNLYLSLPDKRLFKAVIDGRTVGWTWWDVPSAEQVAMPRRSFPAGTQEDVATDLFERMRVNAGKMPCYALEILAVEPEYHRRGVGKALVQWGVDKATEDGLECHLDATVGGVLLYAAMGFETRGSPIVASDGSFKIIPMYRKAPTSARLRSA